MPDNRVSATLPQDDIAVIKAAIATIREKMPFLLALTPEESKSLTRMGETIGAVLNRMGYRLKKHKRQNP